MSPDTWTADGPRISADVLSRLGTRLPVIVEHRFYRGGRAPHRFVCDDGDELERYVRESTKPGDSLWFWNFESCCHDDNATAHGKMPDEHGRVPIGGAY